MPPTASTTSEDHNRRTPLSRQRVLQGAVRLADRVGVLGFTIRKLAEELDTKPMTIYHHVDGKEAILDGMIDVVFDEIDLPPTDLTWPEALRVRCTSAREVLARHPWATPLMESRSTPGPHTLAHHEAVLATLRSGGLSIPLTAHAYAILDSYVYGFALQEASLPIQASDDLADLATSIFDQSTMAAYPHLAELTTQHVLQPGYDFGSSFDYGLEMLLDGLATAAEREASDT